jgi:hypothetical protein
MASLYARTVPVALAVALMSSASFAEDRPNNTLVQKSKSSAVTPAPASKSRTQAATAVSGSATPVKAGSKQATPAAESSAPVSERSYEGCDHAKGAEA